MGTGIILARGDEKTRLPEPSKKEKRKKYFD